MLGYDIQIYRIEDKDALVFHYENFDVQWLDELVKDNKAQTWPSNAYPIKFEVSAKDSIEKLSNISPKEGQTILSDSNTKAPDERFSQKDELINVLKQFNDEQILYIEAWDIS